MSDDHLRFPIGKFSAKESYTSQELDDRISRIESLPSRIETLVKNFSAKQFDTPYREGGWTARQVLHHIPDSHMNAYIRFKWTITESTPTIKAYDEKLWAETPEIKLDPIVSLNLLKALHIKWTSLLKLLTADDLQKQFFHPESKKHMRLDRMVDMYAWHGDHHLGHLQLVAKK